MRRFVKIRVSTPRLRAARIAAMTGGEVRFGVRKTKDCVAFEMRWSIRVFRGVGGGGGMDRKGRKDGQRWCGEGSSILEWADDDVELQSAVIGRIGRSLRPHV